MALEDFIEFVNRELPRRSAFLTYEITGYDGDPNDAGAPDILKNSPKGTWFLENTAQIYWRKYTNAADSWKGASGGVTGPGTSVDNELVRFDGTTGQVIQASNGSARYTDGGNILITGYIRSESYLSAPYLRAQITITGNPRSMFIDGNAGTNEQVWSVGSVSGDFFVHIVDDGETSYTPVIGMTRTGLSVDLIRHYYPVQFDDDVTALGTINGVTLTDAGSGNQFLADDGSYKTAIQGTIQDEGSARRLAFSNGINTIDSNQYLVYYPSAQALQIGNYSANNYIDINTDLSTYSRITMEHSSVGQIIINIGTVGGLGITAISSSDFLIQNTGSGTVLVNGIELVNSGGGNLFLANDGTYKVASGGGGGDVVGPISSVNNAIVLFDGTTGKLIKEGSPTISSTIMDMNGLSIIDALTITSGPILIEPDDPATYAPTVSFYTNNQALDEKRWFMGVYPVGDSFFLYAVNDTTTVFNPVFEVTRSGATPTSINFNTTVIIDDITYGQIPFANSLGEIYGTQKLTAYESGGYASFAVGEISSDYITTIYGGTNESALEIQNPSSTALLKFGHYDVGGNQLITQGGNLEIRGNTTERVLVNGVDLLNSGSGTLFLTDAGTYVGGIQGSIDDIDTDVYQISFSDGLNTIQGDNNLFYDLSNVGEIRLGIGDYNLSNPTVLFIQSSAVLSLNLLHSTYGNVGLVVTSSGPSIISNSTEDFTIVNNGLGTVLVNGVELISTGSGNQFLADDGTYKIVPVITTAEMNIYVRALDGNDSNPGTIALPLATLTEAESRIPFIVNHVIRIYVGPHASNGYEWPTFNGRVLNNSIYVYGNGGGGGSDGFTELVSSTPALAGSDETVIKTSGLSTTQYGGFGIYWGATIEILSGAATGDKRVIRNHTATDIYPNYPFSAVVSSGDNYRIVLPAINIYSSTQYVPALSDDVGIHTTGYGSTVEPRLWIINFNFNVSTGYCRFQAENSAIQLFGVYTNNFTYFSAPNSTIVCGYELDVYPAGPTVPSPMNDLGIPNELSWLGWGYVNRSLTQFPLITVGTRLYGSLNAKGIGMSSVGTFFDLFLGSLWGETSPNSGTIKVTGGAVAGVWGYYNELLIGSLTATINAFLVRNSGTLLYTGGFGEGEERLTIKCSGDAIVSTDESKVMIDCWQVTDMNIESSSGIGLKTKNQGNIEIIDSLFNISAGGGDFSEDNGETIRDFSDLTMGSIYADFIDGRIYRGL